MQASAIRSANEGRNARIPRVGNRRTRIANANPVRARPGATAGSMIGGSVTRKAMKFLDNAHAVPRAISQRY